MQSMMSQSEFARHRGWSKSYVSKLIGNGKIPETAIHVDGAGRKKIDAAAADLALGETAERVSSSVPVADDGADDAAAAGDGGHAGFGESQGSGLNKAKTALTVYEVRLAQLKYEREVGKLLSVEDVTRSMERVAEVLVRDLDLLASRADDLAGAFTAGGVDAVRRKLREITREIRGAIAENMKILPGEALVGAETTTEPLSS
jgi:hypothetical protein